MPKFLIVVSIALAFATTPPPPRRSTACASCGGAGAQFVPPDRRTLRRFTVSPD